MADKDAIEQAWQEVNRQGLSTTQIEQIRLSLIVPPNKRLDGLIDVLKEGNLVNTEIAARLFIENYPEHPLGWQILGEVLHDAQQYEQALVVKRQTLKKYPDDPNAYNNLARTLLTIEDYAATKQYAQQALALEPNHRNAQYHLLKANQALEQEKATSAGSPPARSKTA